MAAGDQTDNWFGLQLNELYINQHNFYKWIYSIIKICNTQNFTINMIKTMKIINHDKKGSISLTRMAKKR